MTVPVEALTEEQVMLVSAVAREATTLKRLATLEPSEGRGEPRPAPAPAPLPPHTSLGGGSVKGQSTTLAMGDARAPSQI